MNEASLRTIYSWQAQAQQRLEAAGVTTARLDVLILLSDVLGQNKAWVLAHPEQTLSGAQLRTLNKNIAQRCKHTPLAYIRGHSEFYGHSFMVNKKVLIPRPESEALIILLQQFAQANTIRRIIDVGTGSGALAIAAKLALPQIDVIGTDISKDCIGTAQDNARLLNAPVTFVWSNLLTKVRHLVTSQTVLVCNLPYVPVSYHINAAAAHEPGLALFSGEDGLNHYRELFTQIRSINTGPTCILTESLPFQHQTLATLAAAEGYRLDKHDGLAQRFIHKA